MTDHGLVLRRVQEREGKLDAGGESAPTNIAHVCVRYRLTCL